MDIKISKLSFQDIIDFKELIKVFKIAFEMNDFKMPDMKYLKLLLKKPDFFPVVAKSNNKVVGGLTVYILYSYYSTRPSAYIYDLGILPEYQRKNIGKELISYLIQFCKENGFEDVYVEAETEDVNAVSFYRKTAFSSELQATHFTYILATRNGGFSSGS